MAEKRTSTNDKDFRTIQYTAALGATDPEGEHSNLQRALQEFRDQAPSYEDLWFAFCSASAYSADLLRRACLIEAANQTMKKARDGFSQPTISIVSHGVR